MSSIRFLGALLLTAALTVGCGAESPVAPDDPGYQEPAPQPQQPSSEDPRPMLQAVSQSYQALSTMTADYEVRQLGKKGSYTATVKFQFEKPRKLSMKIETCSDALRQGAKVVWLGSGKIRAKKMLGFVPIQKEHELSEPDALSVRGYRYDETDFHAMVQALLAPQANPRMLGPTTVAGVPMELVEIRPTLAGGQTERIGVDRMTRLPVYREVREGGQIVYYQLYTHLRVNAKLPSDAFKL